MNRDVVDVDIVRQRASATPDGGNSPARAPIAAGDRDSSRARRGRAPEPETFSCPSGMRQEQIWFARAIMTPEAGQAAASEVEANGVLTAGPRLHAIDRLEIYRRSYHARLLECLADDYPVLAHALGGAQFEDLCRGFIERHPSEGPNLNFFGRGFEKFCLDEATPPFPLRRFSADLAKLEWAIVEVIHAPSSEPLTIEGLREVPIDAWASARLVHNSAFRLLSFENPVNAYFQAFRDGKNPEVPGAHRSATVVYRSGATVWRMDLTGPMFEVLSALVAGETLGVSLSRAESTFDDVEASQAADRVAYWFREWVASGLFVRVDID